MIELTAKSLDEVPEIARPLCKEENGKISLDETLIMTKADIDKLEEAKRKEVNDRNAVNAELTKWKKLGKSPDEVQEKITDLETRAGNGSDLTDKVANLQRDNRKLKSDYDALKTDYDGMKPKFEAQQKIIHEAKTLDVLTKAVGKLKGVDNDRLTRTLRKDIALGLIDLDESGEGLAVKTGESFEEYAMGQAKDLNFLQTNTPGLSKPASGINPAVKLAPENPTAVPSFLSDEVKSQLDKT